MNDNEKLAECLKKAYAIADQFKDMVDSEILEKGGTLLMSSTYEGLASAAAYIGQALEAIGDPDAPAYQKHALQAESTRDAVRAAYARCVAITSHIIPGSASGGLLGDAMAYLENCLYVMLGKTYAQDPQQAIGNILEICDLGCNALDDIDAIPEEELDTCLDPSHGINMKEEITALRDLFASLRPKYDPDKADGCPEGGGEA